MSGFKPFEKRIMARVPGAAQPAVRDAIIQAMQQLCRRTRLWRETDSFTTSENQPEIVAVPSNAVLFEIESMRFDDHPVEAVTVDWLDDNVSQWRTLTSDQVKWVTQLEPDTLRIVPMASGTLDLSLFLAPADDATTFPDWMERHYTACIADGALGILMTIPGQDFTSPQLAQFHMQKFERELDRLSGAFMRGQQRARTRTKASFF